MTARAAQQTPPLSYDVRSVREHLVSLARLVIDCALQPIVEINSGAVYGYEALMAEDANHIDAVIAELKAEAKRSKEAVASRTFAAPPEAAHPGVA